MRKPNHNVHVRIDKGGEEYYDAWNQRSTSEPYTHVAIDVSAAIPREALKQLTKAVKEARAKLGDGERTGCK